MYSKPNQIKLLSVLIISFFFFIQGVAAQDPSIDHIDDIYLVESSSPSEQTVVLSGISGTSPLTVSAASNNTSLIPNPDVNYNTSDTTLTFTPIADVNGQATITVTITNGNNVSIDSTFTVFVNGKPDFVSGSSVSFEENLSGTVIDVNATDPEDSTVTFSLKAGIEDNDIFSINTATGEVTFISSPDYESPSDNNNDNDYILKVAATDNGSPAASDTLTITVSVTNVNEPPEVSDDNYTTSEDITLDVTSNGVLSNDEDPEGDSFTAAIVDSTEHGTVILNEDGTFTFKPDTNYFGPDNFSYRAIDSESNESQSATVSITITEVNDAPVINSNDTAFIDEGQTQVFTVTATDEENNNISFSITDGIDKDLFSIDSSTGEVSFISAPDFENPEDDGNNNTYNISVTATDDGTPFASSTTQDVAVIVRDVNESAPVFTSSDTAVVNENATSVLTVVASDQENSTITYSLPEGTNDNDIFTIGESNGVLEFSSAPDYEQPIDGNNDNVYIVNVVASDNQNPAQTTTQTITVIVNDINEGAPSFSSPTSITAEENQKTTLTVEASDPEGYTVTYTLSDDNTTDNNLFTIDTNTGVLMFIDAPDFENPTDLNTDNNYIINVIASDNQASPLTKQLL